MERLAAAIPILAPMVGTLILLEQGLDLRAAVEVLLVRFMDVFVITGTLALAAAMAVGLFLTMMRLKGKPYAPILASAFGVTILLLALLLFLWAKGDIVYDFTRFGCWSIYY